MRDSLRTILYAAILGLVCALLLTAAAAVTGPYKEDNARAEQIRNVLMVLKAMPDDSRFSSRELVELFDKHVRQVCRGQLSVYVYSPPHTGEGSGPAGVGRDVTAIAFAGPGLWGPIKGFLALEDDMRTIAGISFYEQEETPGLGGEIASRWFSRQFVGKRIVDADGTPGIRLVKAAARANEVDAITGATMTCGKVEAMLDRVIAKVVREEDANGR